MSIVVRLKHLLSELNLNQTDFARKIETPLATFAALLSRNGNVGEVILVNILKAYPTINPYWLLLGQGEIWLDEQDASKESNTNGKENLIALQKEIEGSKKENELLREMIKSKERELESKNEIIELLKSKTQHQK